MAFNRRNFLKAGLSGAAMAIGGTAFAACAGKPASTEASPAAKLAGIPYQSAAQLNLSLQEGVAPGNSLNEKLDFMEKNGVVGLEPGGGDLAKRVNELKQALNGRNIKISAICAGFKGFILSTEHEHGTTVIFEPLNRQEAFYLRQVADAASLCRDINNPGVRCMGDFWHMSWEETSDMGAFISAGEYLQHVHVASLKRRSMPGEDGDADNYVEGFKGLKAIGYNKYVSFECGCQSEDKAAAVVNALNLLRKQWEEA